MTTAKTATCFGQTVKMATRFMVKNQRYPILIVESLFSIIATKQFIRRRAWSPLGKREEIIMKVQIALFAILSMAVTLCSTAHAAGVSVTIKEVMHDAKGNSTSVRLAIVNDSGKEVTAYVICVTTTYADGQKTQGWRDEEMLGNALIPSLFTQGHHHPGDAYEIEEGVGGIPGDPIQNIEANVDVVIYADRTAEVYNQQSFDRIMNIRAATDEGARLTISAIKQVLNNPDNPHPVQDVIDALEPRTKGQWFTGKEDFVGMFGLSSFLSNLHNMKSGPDQGKALQRYLKQVEADLAITEPHSKIRRVN
jgi:hypothetical protein